MPFVRSLGGRAALLVVAMAGCPREGPSVTSSPDAGQRVWTMPERPDCPGSYRESAASRGALEDPLLTEVSGIVASPSQAGLLWLHNDSGDEARLYATSTDGSALLRLTLPGVDAVDVEDIAAAPCPDGSGPCLWLADTGNNAADRDEVAIYAVREPFVDTLASYAEAEAEQLWRLPVSYPGEPVDIEAVVVERDASAVVAIEKVDGPSARVFALRAPFSTSEATELEEIGSFASPGIDIPLGRMITAADLHPSAPRLALRTYTGVFEVWLGAGGRALDLPGKEFVVVTYGPLSEPQGEAIGYDDSGLHLWTVSEDTNGDPGQPLHLFECY